MLFAIIGCGQRCKAYIRQLKSKVKWLCDLKLRNMIKYKEIFPTYLQEVNLTTNYRNINDIDYAIICTEDHTHFEIAEYFIKRNINVIIEKPVTLSFAKSKLLLDLAICNNVFIYTALVLVFSPDFNKYINCLKTKNIKSIDYTLYMTKHHFAAYKRRWHTDFIASKCCHDFAIIDILMNFSDNVQLQYETKSSNLWNDIPENKSDRCSSCDANCEYKYKGQYVFDVNYINCKDSTDIEDYCVYNEKFIPDLLDITYTVDSCIVNYIVDVANSGRRLIIAKDYDNVSYTLDTDLLLKKRNHYEGDTMLIAYILKNKNINESHELFYQQILSLEKYNPNNYKKL